MLHYELMVSVLIKGPLIIFILMCENCIKRTVTLPKPDLEGMFLQVVSTSNKSITSWDALLTGSDSPPPQAGGFVSGHSEPCSQSWFHSSHPATLAPLHDVKGENEVEEYTWLFKKYIFY